MKIIGRIEWCIDCGSIRINMEPKWREPADYQRSREMVVGFVECMHDTGNIPSSETDSNTKGEHPEES